MLSSKMLAGLIAGGLGVMLEVVLVYTVLWSPTFTALLGLCLIVVVSILAGALAALWLDLADYGRQAAVGAFAGLVAAWTVEGCDLLLRILTAIIDKPNPTTLLYDALAALLPQTGVLAVVFLILTNLFLYLMYACIVVGSSGVIAHLVGFKKSARALDGMVAAEKERFEASFAAGEEEVFDPALWQYHRRDYSPFITEAPPPIPPWQRRRLELEGRLSEQDETTYDSGNSRIYRTNPPTAWQGPKQRSEQKSHVQRGSPPPTRQGPKQRGQGRER